jgi:nicotinamide mononucleotide transporter
MNEILQSIWSGFTGASALEQIATVLGFAGVWLMIRQIVWAFPIGLVQVALFGWVCFAGRLYSETALQVMFFVALAYGWVHWTRGHDRAHPLPVTWLTPRARTWWIAGTLLLWFGWGTVMHRYTNADLAYADGFVFAVSVASQWLQARKVLENWIGWMIANAVAIGVFWVKGYYWFTVLYAVFGLMAVAGFRAWRRSLGGAVKP